MASPYYRCPNCHNVSRKNDNMFEMVEISGPNTVFAVAGGVPCPDCGASHSFDDVYVHSKYDVPIEDVYGGKVGADLQLIRRASEVGKIRLSGPEKVLLQQARPSSPAQKASSNTQQKVIGCGPGATGILFLIAAAVSAYFANESGGGYGTSLALAGLGLIALIAAAKPTNTESKVAPIIARTPSTTEPIQNSTSLDTRVNIAQDMRKLAEKHEGDAPILQIMLGTLADSLVSGRTQGGERVNPGEIPQLLDQLASAQREQGLVQLSRDVQALTQRIRRIE